LLAIRATALDPACLLGEALALVDGPGYSRVTTGLPWQAASISLGHLPQGWLVSLTFTGASGALAQLHPVAGASIASLVAAALRRPGVDLDAIRQLHDRRAEIGATRQRVQQAEGIVAGFEAQARVVAAGWVQLPDVGVNGADHLEEVKARREAERAKRDGEAVLRLGRLGDLALAPVVRAAEEGAAEQLRTATKALQEAVSPALTTFVVDELAAGLGSDVVFERAAALAG